MGKGTHKGVKYLYFFIRKKTKNFTQNSYVLKCDIKKFFASVDHNILKCILFKTIKDENVQWLLENVIDSFYSDSINIENKIGLPIGNLTSQLFANVYMNELDQYIKNVLRIKYYLRYTDDFIIVDDYEKCLYFLDKIRVFLKDELRLELHPTKIILKKCFQGIDFLGYRVFPHHILLKTKTKKRVLKKIKYKYGCFKNSRMTAESFNQSLQSYFGTLSHCNGYKLKKKILEILDK